ncbi:hypothetical protein DL93DRAFT_2090579 [Clavulina sp. PMI_390]|nr:hypothetical protein DL93DRAFT_2090579 [Clavulina sp. PMI_390]
MAAQPASAATTSTPSAPTQASAPQPQSLAEILDGPEDDAATAIDSDSPNPQHGADDEDDADDDGRIAQEGYCVECEDQLAETYCEQCADSFCDVCFTSVHRKGTRKLHKRSALKSARRNQTSSSSSSATAITTPNSTQLDNHAQDSGEVCLIDLLASYGYS